MKKLLLYLLLFTSFNLAAQVPSYVPADSLVGWWPFNGNANDVSGNGNDGTVNGATITTDRLGNPNSAYSFDGNIDHIDIPNSSELELNSSDYSISFWVYFNSVGSDLISKRDGSGGYSITTSSTEHYAWHWPNGTGPLSTYNFNQWLNVSYVYSNGLQELKLYSDGVLVNTISLQSVGSNSGILRFGGDALLNTYWHDGFLDDIGIWNRALDSKFASLVRLAVIVRAELGFRNHCYPGEISPTKYAPCWQWHLLVSRDSRSG